MLRSSARVPGYHLLAIPPYFRCSLQTLAQVEAEEAAEQEAAAAKAAAKKAASASKPGVTAEDKARQKVRGGHERQHEGARG